MIFLSPPIIFPSVKRQIESCLESGYLSTVGGQIDELEDSFRSYGYSLCLNSATSGLHLALKNLNVGKGDIVLCQTLTFISCVNAIKYLGGEPVFVDSEYSTWNMDPDLLEHAIIDCINNGTKPKAIIAVHIYGMPYKHNEIFRIAQAYDIPIVEDAAEALGSIYKSEKCGALGDLSVFSFNGNKILSMAGGGMLISKNPKHRDKAKFWAFQSKEQDAGYLHNELGYNYGMSNIQAAIGLGMIPHLNLLIQDRRRIFDEYKRELGDIVEWQPENAGSYSNRWLSAGLLPSREKRDEIIEILAQNHFESRPVWRPMHEQPFCSGNRTYLNGISSDLGHRGICLPSGYGLDPGPIINIIQGCI